MKYCPKCGTENTDEAQFCVACGSPLTPKIQPTRTTITEHLTYAVNTAASNLKIFVPHIATYLLVIGFFVIIFINVGIEYAYTGDFDPSTLPGGVLKMFMLFMLIMVMVGILSIPFLQHLYQSAIKQEPVSFTESAKYALSRFISYLGAELLVFVLMIVGMIIWFASMPMEALLNYPDIDYTQYWTYGVWMLLLIPPDQGVGLSKQDINKLFEPFPDIHLPDVPHGTGLGLSICKGIINLHGGRIWAYSAGENKGSTFAFTIPN